MSAMVYYFIDESVEGLNTEERTASLCCVQIMEPDEVHTNISALKEDILHDPRFENILGSFSTNGFHHTSDHREIKNAFINLLRTLTFQAYICFDSNVSGDDFNSTYDRLFKKIFLDRLKNHKTENIIICFEQHGKPERRRREISNIVNLLIKDINESDRRPFRGTAKVTYGSKKDLCLSIADYICGVFNAYMKKRSDSMREIPEERDFEGLRMKIRWIHDIGKKEYYDRRNPFP